MRRASHADALPTAGLSEGATPDGDLPRAQPAYRAHMEATLSVMAVSVQSSQRRSLPDTHSFASPSNQRSASMSTKHHARTRGIRAAVSAVSHSMTPGGGSGDSSSGKTDEDEDDDGSADADEEELASQLMHIFSLSRPPDRERQLAEAQGLPLSSRLIQHPRARGHTAAPESPAPASRPANPPHSTRLRRMRTLPLTVADSRRAVREMAARPAGSSPPPGSRSATTSSRPSPDPASPQLPALPYGERMDYIIPFTKRHLQNEYWLGVHAHFSYWTSRETVHHILHHIIRKPIPSAGQALASTMR
ncbi:hypothetical protein LPJ61_006016 [Coemansia biformis]|uniref:DDHD domain-containing protein n=1 Tax=Coemansia biformis TaxID=1286918 RepID=A0A9W8CRI9_9FUNG|nr:hypothetical protein LPJ61_006016 [Coemansia biformis]